MKSGDVIDLIEAHAGGDERKWLDTLEEIVKWERKKGNDVLADDIMRAMWDGWKDRRMETDGCEITIVLGKGSKLHIVNKEKEDEEDMGEKKE